MESFGNKSRMTLGRRIFDTLAKIVRQELPQQASRLGAYGTWRSQLEFESLGRSAFADGMIRQAQQVGGVRPTRLESRAVTPGESRRDIVRGG